MVVGAEGRTSRSGVSEELTNLGGDASRGIRFLSGFYDDLIIRYSVRPLRLLRSSAHPFIRPSDSSRLFLAVWWERNRIAANSVVPPAELDSVTGWRLDAGAALVKIG